MTDPNIFRNPRQTHLEYLNQEELQEIHDASLEILERTGVNLHHPEAVGLLHDAGAHVEESTRVRIPSDLVKKALQTAPERVALADRAGTRSILLENRRVFFGLGSDLKYTIDLETQQRRMSVLADVARAARVSDALPHIDFLMSQGLASDVPFEMAELLHFDAMIRNSLKPMILTSFSDLRVLEATFEMACIVRGGHDELLKNPYIIIYGQFISPFEHHREGIERLLFCSEKRLPIIYVPTIMAGTSGPVTLAGAIAVANAECLAGLVVHQLKNPGAPFIYGGCVQSFDMRSMNIPYGSPEWRMGDAVLSQLSQMYKLPVFGTAGCTDSKLVDEQASLEAAYSMLFAALTGTNIIHDLGYLESGMCGALEFIVMCNEIAGLTRRLLKGIRIDQETLALDLIDKIGPGGHFTAEDHTLKFFKEETWYPSLLDRRKYASWKNKGSKTFKERCIEEAKSIIQKHTVPPLAEDVDRRLAELLKKMEKNFLKRD
jgi:trimethylamine---corrinoid protein Co-methyltransferase